MATGLELTGLFESVNDFQNVLYGAQWDEAIKPLTLTLAELTISLTLGDNGDSATLDIADNSFNSIKTIELHGDFTSHAAWRNPSILWRNTWPKKL
jgi:hypothetical protein